MDSAYAGVSAMLPEMASHFEGLDVADSFDTNPHKWLLTNFDCSTLFVRDATHLKLALTLNPTFLVNKTNEYDYKVRIIFWHGSDGPGRSLRMGIRLSLTIDPNQDIFCGIWDNTTRSVLLQHIWLKELRWPKRILATRMAWWGRKRL